jgi:hypothetical protein
MPALTQLGRSLAPVVPTGLSPEDNQFLEDLEKASFLFFWEQASPESGLVKDRCNVRTSDRTAVASIAATGFGLTALCIGQKNGWVSLRDARERAIVSLRFLARKMPTHRGFFFHWANLKTGERTWDSEVSSVDTALLLCGVLTCRQHFQYAEITRLAYEVFNRIDWTWLSEDTSLLPHGWMPEAGFLPYRWDYYSEHMMMYLLGLGSSTHPLPAETWNAWKRTTFEYDGLRYIGSFAPLFIHQYSQAWFDFRGKRDRYADYFNNSITATEAHRRFCLQLHKQFPDYSDDLWGITASDSQYGYVVWGGPPEIGPIDGTVVPSAAGGSLAFSPRPRAACSETYQPALRVRSMEPVRTGQCIQSIEKVVRHGCDRTRYWNHFVNGRKSAHQFCVEHVYEKSRSAAWFPACRLHQQVVSPPWRGGITASLVRPQANIGQ